MTSQKDVVSVIIPIYKVDAYLDKCIASVVAQSYEWLDIVLVDDGSPDKCPVICDQWVKKDSRIRALHKKNEGVTKARLSGLKLAKGQWVFFSDADDVLPPNAIEVLVGNSCGCDIVVGQVAFNGPYKWPYPSEKIVVSKKEYLSKLLGRYKLHGGPVAKLFRRDLLSDWTFDIPRKIVCGEDFIMNIRIARRIKKANIIRDVVYFYEFRGDSALSKKPFASFRYVLSFEKFVLASFERKDFIELFPMIALNFMNHVISFAKENVKKLVKFIISI